MNDAVLFRSDQFSIVPPEENGRRYDLPLGDDMARLIAERLRRPESGWMVAEPVREDWGTVLEVRLPEPYLLSIHWAPGHQMENRWGIQFSRPVGCLGLLLGKQSSPNDCRKAQAVIAELLAQDPEMFTNVEWLSQLEYHRRM